MRSVIAALAAGIVFGVGLSISGMTDPAIVLAFLDIAGEWNPRLAFVMGAAVPTTFLGYRWAFRRSAPILGGTFSLPPTHGLDRALIGGAALFGMGWGLAGYCPGPAIASLSAGRAEVIGFVAAMLVGMTAVRVLFRLRPQARSRTGQA